MILMSFLGYLWKSEKEVFPTRKAGGLEGEVGLPHYKGRTSPGTKIGGADLPRRPWMRLLGRLGHLFFEVVFSMRFWIDV